jgi:hypothetical protein
MQRSGLTSKLLQSIAEPENVCRSAFADCRSAGWRLVETTVRLPLHLPFPFCYFVERNLLALLTAEVLRSHSKFLISSGHFFASLLLVLLLSE